MRAFTLVETIIVVVIFGIIFLVIVQAFLRIQTAKVDLSVRSQLTKETYHMIERLQRLTRDYTIDYEEYFNRRVVGCDSNKGTTFTWDVDDKKIVEGLNKDGTSEGSRKAGNAHCDTPTYYGNHGFSYGSDINTSSNSMLYHCTSNSLGSLGSTSEGIISGDIYVSKGSIGCWNLHSRVKDNPQPYGQYALQFIDVGNDTDGTNGIVFDDDDVIDGDSANNNNLIAVADHENVQELYLISTDKAERLFIRRRLIEQKDFDGDGVINDHEKLYTLEMLRLRGFDAGYDHNFDGSTDGLYDGKIDTRACDYRNGFSCIGNTINGTFANYRLPTDNNDGRVPIFSNQVTVTDRNLTIHPVKDPELAFANQTVQSAPYITLHLTTHLYAGPRHRKINTSTLQNYKLSIQTTFNLTPHY